MTQIVQLPLWLFILIVLFAAVTALSHFLLPSVRWFFRRRFERAVARLNTRLKRPIEPFRLARRYDMIQRLIYDPDVTREIVNYAKSNGVPENVAFQKAQSYAREIVPSFSAFAYFSFGIWVARLLVTSVYWLKPAATNDATFDAIPKDATVVFVMNHRSNMDYVLVTYLAARSSALAYAVGEWARVWPLSFLIRSMGAYFIRRRSRGALYRKVLARYVQMATEGGVTQAMYPEGGLSLTGKMQAPKMGLLSYIVEGAAAGAGRDVVFVPVAINYDRVLEDKVLIAAHARGNRRFGAKMGVVARFIVNKLWERVRGKVKHFGSAAVAFGAPLSLAAFQAQSGPAGGSAPRAAATEVFGTTEDVARLSEQLMQRIKAAIPVPVVPLLARVLLSNPRIAEGDLLAQIKTLNGHIPAANRILQEDELAPELRFAMEQLALRDVVSLEGDIWQLDPAETDLIAFYANSIAHFFDPANGNNAAHAKEIAAPAGS